MSAYLQLTKFFVFFRDALSNLQFIHYLQLTVAAMWSAAEKVMSL